METILNAGLGIGALMLMLLLFKKGKKQGDYFFLCWIAIMLGQITFYAITVYQFELTGILAIALFSLPLLGAPLLFLYILSLTGHNVTWRTIISHLSIYVLYVLLFWYLKQYDEVTLIAINGFFQMKENVPQWMLYYAIPLAISGLVYCIWDLLLLKNHRRRIADIFSFDEKVDLKWINYIVYSYFVLFLLASFLIFGATQFQLFPIENAFALVGITLSLVLIAFGFYGFRQTAIFSNIDSQTISALELQSVTSEKASYSKSGLTAEKIKSLADQLTAHMEIEKPFLNEELNLPLLAEKSEIPQSHISQVINQHFQMHFYDFVNQYRVEEAKKMLSSPEFDHLSVLGIAFECGFKSKSSFNRYFKKYTGVSPSEFKKK
jgi:AraC-like DNA-binding protein